MKKAVVLLSGGLDSTTVLAIAKDRGFIPHAISFNYGQRHKVELEAASTIATRYEVAQHVTLDVDLRAFGGSALTDDSLDVPKHSSVHRIQDDGFPITYVPARNTIFLSFALAYAETIRAYDIFIGVNALDYSGYPDCRPKFIKAFEDMARLATHSGVSGSVVEIHAPLIAMSKSEIIRTGMKLGVDYGLTSSCYDPDGAGHPCGYCDSCLLRLNGFAQAGLTDPLPYQDLRNG